MALSLTSLPPNAVSIHTLTPRSRTTSSSSIRSAAAIGEGADETTATRLVTFLGKGGSGKTTSAVFAAQHYARQGLRTCLVTHSQDQTINFLLNCKIGTDPIVCGHNLTAVRLETAQLLLEPLHRLKQADSRINMSQGFLQGIVGGELGVLPGMDSILSVSALEGLIGGRGLHWNAAKRNQLENKFEVVIYDGTSPEETLRMIAAAGSARLYLKYLRNMADKTDLGRLAGPSLLRLVSEAMSSSGKVIAVDGKLSSEIWDSLEKILQRKSSAFAKPETFGCYLVMDPSSAVDLRAALRYWGCAIQAGAQVSGAFGSSPTFPSEEGVKSAKKSFSSLPFALIPSLSLDPAQDWHKIMQSALAEDARKVLEKTAVKTGNVSSSVKYDMQNKSITLFMPGFDKSEIKLYQYRGGSELLVEAGDQRRVIELPREVQGKVSGAKFIDRSLVIKMS